MDLATRVKLLRGARTQQGLARAAGMSGALWCQLEAGSNPSMRTLQKVASAFGMSAAQLMDGVEPPQAGAPIRQRKR